MERKINKHEDAVAIYFKVGFIDEDMYDTDKSKSQKERLKEAIKKHPCVWTSYSNDEKTKTDYWKLILTNYK